MVLLSSMTRTFKPLRWELVSVTRKPLLDKQNSACAPLLKCGAVSQADGVLTYRNTPGYAGHVTFLRSEMSMPKTTSLAVVMDPIAKIKFAKDSTLAMLLAAAARGWQLTYFEQSDLFLRDGVAYGRGRPLNVFANPEKWFELGESRLMKLGEFDCVFMRKDPPFDAEYIYTTYILERAQVQGAFIANDPQGLRDMNEKVYTAWFP